MNKFINIRDGRAYIASYRHTNCLETTLDDLITCAVEGSSDNLTASFTTDELCKHPKACAFLTQYGVKCGTRRHGGTVMVLDWDAFVVFADNTVVVDIA